jgi:hypothetical protein
MKTRNVVVILLAALMLFILGSPCLSGEGPSQCLPDRPIPPETVGSMSLPFDVPVWPTLVKTEFHILPWVSLSKAQVCIPWTGKAIQFTAPCLSLKPIPVWFPWLRPIDAECGNCEPAKIVP